MNSLDAEVLQGEVGAPIFERSPDPILVVDRQTCSVLAANRAASQAYGYAIGELCGLPVSRVWPKAEPLLRRGRRFDWGHRTWRHRRKNGEWIDVAITVQELSVGGRSALALYLSDVTERELSAELLRSQGRVLEMVARGRPLDRILGEILRTTERLCPGMIGSILRLDEARRTLHHGAGPSLPPEYWRACDGLPVGPQVGSCGTAAYLGRPVIVGDIAADPLWTECRAAALAYGLRACSSTPIVARNQRVLGVFAMYCREARVPTERELRIVRAGSDLAAIAIERDIADRALQDSEARLRAIIDQAFAVVFVKDLEGRYRVVNRRFESFSGISEAQALGRGDEELFPPDLADAFRASDREVLQTGRPVEFEESFPHRAGEDVWLTVKFPLCRADGTPYAVCGIATDITRRKRAERALEESSERLRALTARLHGALEAERTRIAREVHDVLGQMLTALRMKQALLVRRVRQRDAALAPDELAEEIESMHALSGDILASVSRIATQLRPQVLDSLGLEAAIEWQAAEFTRHSGIACEVALPPYKLAPDAEHATALFRIFQEALTNVARHSGANRVRAELREANGTIELVVADNGRGITEEALAAASSLGVLGMRERAAILGGETLVTGMPGRGTEVTARLPVERRA